MKKLLVIGAAALMAACGGQKEPAAPQLFDEQNFATELNGKPIGLFTLKNENGMAVQLTNYGARIVDLWVPDKDGGFQDVVMGFETGDAYLNATDINNGPVVGRYGNRIGKGQFTLDGKDYQLTINDGENHLHGGTNGFGGKVWDAKMVKDADGNDVVEMSYVSADGEEGYPGNLNITVSYTLTPKNELVINYKATTDSAATILNPTSHSYFNLHGTNEFSTNSHIMMINADSFTPTDKGLIPTGEIVAVEGTPLDFRTPTAIGDRVDADFEAIKFGGGYDHNWVLNKPEAGAVSLAAEVYEPRTGIVMKVLTDQPGMQFYSGNFMNGKETGKRGNVNNYRSGIALETQNFPDAINHENFPSPILRAGETYNHVCVYAFEVRK